MFQHMQRMMFAMRCLLNWVPSALLLLVVGGAGASAIGGPVPCENSRTLCTHKHTVCHGILIPMAYPWVVVFCCYWLGMIWCGCGVQAAWVCQPYSGDWAVEAYTANLRAFFVEFLCAPIAGHAPIPASLHAQFKEQLLRGSRDPQRALAALSAAKREAYRAIFRALQAAEVESTVATTPSQPAGLVKQADTKKGLRQPKLSFRGGAIRSQELRFFNSDFVKVEDMSGQ